MELTPIQLEYIVSDMCNSARIGFLNNVGFNKKTRENPSRLFMDTFKQLDLWEDETVRDTIRDAVIKHMEDNQELYMIYGEKSEVLESI